MPVLWSVVEISADRPDRNESRRPVMSVTDGVDWCRFVGLRGLLNRIWWCDGVGSNFRRIVPIGTDRNDPSHP